MKWRSWGASEFFSFFFGATHYNKLLDIRLILDAWAEHIFNLTSFLSYYICKIFFVNVNYTFRTITRALHAIKRNPPPSPPPKILACVRPWSTWRGHVGYRDMLKLKITQRCGAGYVTGVTGHKGVELKLVRGGRFFGLRARKFPLRAIFPPPGHDFCPPLGVLFQFFLFILLGWPSLHGGDFPPLWEA